MTAIFTPFNFLRLGKFNFNIGVIDFLRFLSPFNFLTNFLKWPVNFLGVDEMGQAESNHHEHSGKNSHHNENHHQKSINTLNLINSVLLRKNALNKLSR